MSAKHQQEFNAIYQLLQERAQSSASLRRILLGINWTVAETAVAETDWRAEAGSSGLCFSPINAPRNLPWSGTLAGRQSNELVKWLAEDNASAVAVGLATANAVINHEDNHLLRDAKALDFSSAPHLAVFDHFAPQLQDAAVAIIGRYPEIDQFKSRFGFVCIERRPGPDDLPETAAAEILPKSDWVFITASSIANKTLPYLLSLCRNSQVVLMGPSMPWLAEWADFGVDYLAGVAVTDVPRLRDIVAEAGGTRIFQEAVQYRVLPLR